MQTYRIRKTWLFFRYGHSLYFSLFLSFVTFVLLSYRFIIEPNLEKIPFFSNLTTFALIFTSIYIPLAIIIGYWHRTTQLKVETDIKFLRNKLLSEVFGVLMDIHSGNASEKQIKELESTLEKIAKKGYIKTSISKDEKP